jgi:hypothetical protein
LAFLVILAILLRYLCRKQPNVPDDLLMLQALT